MIFITEGWNIANYIKETILILQTLVWDILDIFKMSFLLVCFFLSARQRWKKSNKYNGTETPEIVSSCYWARSFIWSWKLASLSSGFTSSFMMLIHLDLLAFLFFWKTSRICNDQTFSTQVKPCVCFFSSPFPAYNVDNRKQLS